MVIRANIRRFITLMVHMYTYVVHEVKIPTHIFVNEGADVHVALPLAFTFNFLVSRCIVTYLLILKSDKRS